MIQVIERERGQLPYYGSQLSLYFAEVQAFAKPPTSGTVPSCCYHWKPFKNHMTFCFLFLTFSFQMLSEENPIDLVFICPCILL